MNKNRWIAVLVLAALVNCLNAQRMLKGIIVEKDSNTVMPFVYLINKSNGNGTMTDNDGKFVLASNNNDTLICSYVGYAKEYLPVSGLVANSKGEIKIVMDKQYINLNAVTVNSFKVKPYEREYMNSIIDRSKIKTMDYFASPISALYAQYSKEGKQVRKLARIFEGLMIEEEVQKKFSESTFRRLTGDQTADYYDFRRYCYNVSNEFIITHDGVELYSKIMECYRRWKGEKGDNINNSANKNNSNANTNNSNYKSFNQDGYKSRNKPK